MSAESKLRFSVSTRLSTTQRPWVWQLLQSTSREPDSPYAIESEYPIVLGDCMTQASVCLTKAPFQTCEDLLCHLSLWPRQLASEEPTSGFEVGLIGNVATHPDWRRKGLMTTLLRAVSERAHCQGLSALILWSDLTELYAKQGFVATSKEVRYIFHRDRLIAELTADEITAGYQLQLVQPRALSDDDLCRCLALRPAVPYTLRRTAKEFRRLLTIPNLFVFVHRDPISAKVQSFYLVEKGADMPQVVHEWGLSRQNTADAGRKLAAELLVIGEALGYEQLLLLAPVPLEPALVKACQHFAIDEETHPMALIKVLGGERELRQALSAAFIWGLDGI